MKAILFFALVASASAISVGLQNNCGYNINVFDGSLGRVVKTLVPKERGSYNPANPGSFNLFKQGGGLWAEFSFNVNGFDSYDLSVFRGYDGTPLTLSTNAGRSLSCNRNGCPDAYTYSKDDTKSHVVKASGGHTFQLTWC